ncbi:MAG TPA: hypothetical protein VH062_16945 [Polyangiaceae bacterium]|nr:hypothetical protein [Polyangiaceae bacterium]
MAAAALAVVCSAMSACSNFSDDCTVSRTCPEPDAASAGGADGGIAVTGNGGGGTGGFAGTGTGGVTPGGAGRGATGGGTANSMGGSAGRPSPTVDEDAGGLPDAGEPARADAGQSPGIGGSTSDDAGADAADHDSGPLVCADGYADCNGDRADGCEVNLATDTDHCGACATACSAVGTTARACTAGICKPTCDTKHADCNGAGLDGCEVDTTTSLANCGVCGHTCSTANASTEACVASACKPTCATGYADCSKPAGTAADDACETNLSASTSCGACGHDCQGGACDAGQCQPVLLQSGLTGVTQLAADTNYVYFTDYGTSSEPRLMRGSAKSSTSAELLADNLNTASVVSDGAYVYWTTANTASSGQTANGGIVRLPSGGTSPVTIQTGINPMFLAVDGKNVYWTDLALQSVWQSTRDPNAARVHLFDAPYPTSLGTDGTTLYAPSVSEGKLYAIPVGGGALTTLTTLAAGAEMVKSAYATDDPTHVYAWFGDSGGVYSLYQLMKPSLTGGTALTTGSSRGPLSRPIYYGGYVYYAQDDGIYRVSTTSGAKGARFLPVSGSIQYLAAANATLYWVEYASAAQTDSIEKMALF